MFRKNHWFLFLFVLVLFTGCSLFQKTASGDSITENNSMPEKSPKTIAEKRFDDEWKNNYEATSNELERNRKLWLERKVISYDFECEQIAPGVQGWAPVAVKVREGKVISISKIPKDSPAKIDGYENVETIEKMFDFIKQELDKKRIINADYNKEFGYPERLGIVYSFNIDSSKAFNIKKFEIKN